MGDSITVGQYIDVSLRWTTVVDERLRKKYGERGVDVDAFNCGVSGETTRLALERFPAAVQSLRPDILTLQYGLNDCNCWETDLGLPRVSEAAFRANLSEMIERARRAGAKQILLANNHATLRDGPMISGEPYEAANARYSEIIGQVAAEAGVWLCDIRRVFGRLKKLDLEGLLLPAPDHLHLSVEGNRVYAEAIWPLLEEAVECVVITQTEERGVV